MTLLLINPYRITPPAPTHAENPTPSGLSVVSWTAGTNGEFVYAGSGGQAAMELTLSPNVATAIHLDTWWSTSRSGFQKGLTLRLRKDSLTGEIVDSIVFGDSGDVASGHQFHYTYDGIAQSSSGKFVLTAQATGAGGAVDIWTDTRTFTLDQGPSINLGPGGVDWKGWWLASDIALADGAAVSSWPNRGSGSYGPAVTQVGTPAYETTGINGLPCVEFSGSSQALKVANLPSAGCRPETIIIVCKPDSYSGHDSTLFGGQGTGDRNWRMNATSGAQELDRKGANVWAVAGAGATAGQPHLVALRDDGSNIKLIRDGTVDGTFGPNASGYSSGALTYWGTDGSGSYFDGQWGEVLYIPRYLSDADFNAAKAAVAARWGITVV